MVQVYRWKRLLKGQPAEKFRLPLLLEFSSHMRAHSTTLSGVVDICGQVLRIIVLL